MTRLIKLPIALGMVLCATTAIGDEGGGLKTFGVQAADFSDVTMTAAKGESCAAFLKFLQEDEKYVLLNVAGIVGPPGVVYTLRDNKGEIAIVKCGSAGCGHGDDGGHDGEEGHE